MKITSTMVANVRAKVKILSKKYGHDLTKMPVAEVCKVFHPESMEISQSEWLSEQIYANVYKESMMEVLAGEDNDDDFLITQVMSKVQAALGSGYGFRIYDSLEERSAGVVQMSPTQIIGYWRGGRATALDMQGASLNNYCWKGCHPSSWNGNNKLQNFCDAMTLQEDNRFYAFVIRAMSEISGMPMSENLIISGDDKINGEEIVSYEPGEHCKGL